MLCEMMVLLKGCLMGYKFYEVVMSFYVCLIYIKVWYILQGDQDLCEQYVLLVKYFEELYNFYKVLDKVCEECGGILFESEEVKFIFNVECCIECIEQIQCNDVYKLIEECMILVNILVVCFVEKVKELVLFCIYDKLSIEVIIFFCLVLVELGLELLGGNKLELCDYVELLELVVDCFDVEML